MSDLKLRFWASDLEATGLVWDLVQQGDEAKMHNFCSIEIKDKKFEDIQMIYPHGRKGLKELQDWIDDPENVFIIHNAYT